MKYIYIVTVSYRSGHIMSCLSFRDESKARDHYTDMIVKYPRCKVELTAMRDYENI